jgi:hypothetical protein
MSDAEKLREVLLLALDELPDQREELRVPRLVAMVEAAGFRIVPEVATETMFLSVYASSGPWAPADIWRIMLAAAPKVTP